MSLRAWTLLAVVLLAVPVSAAKKPRAGGAAVAEIEDVITKATTENPLDPDAHDVLLGRMTEIIAKLPENPEERRAFVKAQTGSDLVLKTALAAYLQQHFSEQVESNVPKNPLVDGPINPVDPQGLHSRPPQLPTGWDFARDLGVGRVRDNPRDVGANNDLGRMFFLEHNWRGAYDRFNAAYENGGRDPQMVAQMAGAAYESGDYATASRIAREALRLDPKNQEAMVIYQFSKGRVPKVNLPTSVPEFSTDRAADAALPDMGAAAGRTVAAGNAPSAGGAVAAPPPSGMTAQQVADLAAKASAGGPTQLARSMQFTKDSANALRVKDFPVAYQLASEAIVLNPQNAQALTYRAMSLNHMRRYSDAVQDASAALSLAPGSAAVLQTRSWAFSKQGKYKEGLVDAETTLAADPNNAYAYENKAFAQAGLGDRVGALESLRRGAALDGRFTGRLERAVQMPKDADLTLLFDETSAAPAPAAAAPGSTPRRFARLAVLSATGGLLIALGILHVVSASWREKMRMTVRRVLGPSPAAVAEGGGAADSPSMGAFWTQYEVVKEIGLGGMGVVYEALDRSLERRVAVKKMRDEIRLDPADRQRFVSEARMVAQLHHPNIVDIYAIVEDGNDVYLVFEFVEGRTLGDALKAGGPMDLPRAAGVLREIAAAVAHAHERGIIHRDLKPSNVMLTPEGRVKVMDFGVARQAKDAMTRHSMTNTVVGTPPYMAPEQEQGTVRKESDVYALGVCLYEMTTGVLPFNGVGAGMLLNKLNGKWVPPSQRSPVLLPAFDAVIARALSPDPDKRFHTPAELVAALDAVAKA